ncbi:MAG: hypothetical protein ABJD07_00520 [Gemmatimonadaceae bacterium]
MPTAPIALPGPDVMFSLNNTDTIPPGGGLAAASAARWIAPGSDASNGVAWRAAEGEVAGDQRRDRPRVADPSRSVVAGARASSVVEMQRRRVASIGIVQHVGAPAWEHDCVVHRQRHECTLDLSLQLQPIAAPRHDGAS